MQSLEATEGPIGRSLAETQERDHTGAVAVERRMSGDAGSVSRHVRGERDLFWEDGGEEDRRMEVL